VRSPAPPPRVGGGGPAAAPGAGARGHSPDRFGRTRWEAPLEPPYAAVRVTGALFHTQGGLLVDGHARVLRGGEPVPGLYAAGGAAAGISGHGAAGQQRPVVEDGLDLAVPVTGDHRADVVEEDPPDGVE
jgi:hypothetical protein